MTDVADRAGAAQSQLGRREAELLEHLEAIEHLFDRRFRMPGTSIRFGLDPILGLVPVAGDTVSAAVSLYLIWLAHNVGGGARLKSRMVGNVLVDYLVGLVPIIGNIGDVFFKANTRNLRLLKEHLARSRPPRSGASPAGPPKD